MSVGNNAKLQLLSNVMREEFEVKITGKEGKNRNYLAIPSRAFLTYPEDEPIFRCSRLLSV
jgi:hypothetical protein